MIDPAQKIYSYRQAVDDLLRKAAIESLVFGFFDYEILHNLIRIFTLSRVFDYGS